MNMYAPSYEDVVEYDEYLLNEELAYQHELDVESKARFLKLLQALRSLGIKYSLDDRAKTLVLESGYVGNTHEFLIDIKPLLNNEASVGMSILSQVYHAGTDAGANGVKQQYRNLKEQLTSLMVLPRGM